MTLDVETFLQIETYLDKNNQKKERKIMNIYCISYFDGNKAKSFYISDYSSIDKLINAVLRDIFSKNYSGKDIYIHNSSNFDLIFLLKYIVNHPGVKVEPIIKDGNFINLKINI